VKRLSSAIIILFLAVPALASSGEFSPDGIRTFARSLIGKKEYYRALVELKRLESYHPGFLPRIAITVTENYLLFKGKQYRDILAGPLAGADMTAAAAGSLYRCDAAIAMADYGKLENALSAWPAGADPFLSGCRKKRELFAHLAARRYEAAIRLCGNDPGLPVPCAETVERARAGLLIGSKKPYAAALLGIIPGMGYIYSGDIATGIFAFLLVSIDAVMTYFAFRSHNDVIGYFTGAVGGLFYAGSMAGGYLAAQRFNVRQADSARSALMDDLRLERDREEAFERYGIGKE
jgi:hypothetical protein